MLKFKTNVELNVKKLQQKNTFANAESQMILDTQVLKDSNYYVPKDTGNLEASGVAHSRIGDGHIEWNTPYARKLYYNPQYNFSEDTNPNAQGLWFEAAKSNHRETWAEIVKKIYSKYFKGK